MAEYKIDIYDENNNEIATHMLEEDPVVDQGVLLVKDTNGVSYMYKYWGRLETYGVAE